MHIVIIGSGMAGIILAEEVRKLKPGYPVSVLTREARGYYSRPMLSHGFSRDDVESRIILKSFNDLRAGGIEVHAGTEVLSIDRANRHLACRNATGNFTVTYDSLVLAPGSDALVPPPFQGAENRYAVINSLDDLIALRQRRAVILDNAVKPRWAIIGGGIIGCEVASDLARAGDEVVLYHALPRLMERQLEEADSASLLEVLHGLGVDIRLDAAVSGIGQDGGQHTVRRADGEDGGYDGVILACGFKPRIHLAQAAGLETGRGILADSFLRTSDPQVHAIGDAMQFTDGRVYAYVAPIRHQALWLANYLAGLTTAPWQPPEFKPRAKVHGFTAGHPYLT